jgi:catechol 2,3-dioxygenase-like lactoylglutathione lyase family enzyme
MRYSITWPKITMTSVPAGSSPSFSQESVMAAEYYRTNTNRRGLLGHVSFGVHSYEISKKFYTALLKPFGVDLVYDDPTRKILGYGLEANREVVNIFERGKEAHPPGLGTHLAFNAPSRLAVREFWEAGIRNGGRSDGQPGIRENYGKEYYAAFLFDPDGFKLEAVFQEAG